MHVRDNKYESVASDIDSKLVYLPVVKILKT